jgi:hypothetical protein
MSLQTKPNFKQVVDSFRFSVLFLLIRPNQDLFINMLIAVPKERTIAGTLELRPVS